MGLDIAFAIPNSIIAFMAGLFIGRATKNLALRLGMAVSFTLFVYTMYEVVVIAAATGVGVLVGYYAHESSRSKPGE